MNYVTTTCDSCGKRVKLVDAVPLTAEGEATLWLCEECGEGLTDEEEVER